MASETPLNVDQRDQRDQRDPLGRDPLGTADKPASLLWTLDELGPIVSASGNPAETLTNVVHLIQRRFGTDVCSVYLLEPDRANLVLAATIGLRAALGISPASCT